MTFTPKIKISSPVSTKFYRSYVNEVLANISVNKSVTYSVKLYQDDSKISFFYECDECNSCGCPTFFIEEGDQIPNEIIKHLTMHTEMRHAL